jgi:cytochrome c553
MITQREVNKWIFNVRSIPFVLFILPLLAAGCAGETPVSTAPTPVSSPTPVPAPTEVVLAVSDEQLALAAAVGDIAAGEELFNQHVDGVSHSASCSTCHSLDGKNSPDAPTLAGISEVAADRVTGMSDVDYLRLSIVDPGAFWVSGEWGFGMPPQYPDLFSEDQINNLIAFLLTR